MPSPTRTKPSLDLVVPPEAKESISQGRLEITGQIKDNAQRALAEAGQSQSQIKGRGIELVDVGLSRIEFVPQVREAAFDRAISLMEAIAIKAISEGEQRKMEIINKAKADSEKIEGQGKQEANILRGRVDAQIIDSYAKAIRETGEFYNFTRTLEVYKEALKGETRLILTTDSELLRMIKTLEPSKATAMKPSPVAATEPNRPPHLGGAAMIRLSLLQRRNTRSSFRRARSTRALSHSDFSGGNGGMMVSTP